jgi:CARDB
MLIRRAVLAVLALVPIVLSGCATPARTPVERPVARPDLVVLKRVGVRTPGELCNLDPAAAAPRLIVSVKNQGAASAAGSTTRVEFNPGGSFDLATPPVPAGGAVDLPPLRVPQNCFNPNCQFRITVDSASGVYESNAANNSASGACTG